MYKWQKFCMNFKFGAAAEHTGLYMRNHSLSWPTHPLSATRIHTHTISTLRSNQHNTNTHFSQINMIRTSLIMHIGGKGRHSRIRWAKKIHAGCR